MNDLMQTGITKLPGIEHPIISAPMGPDMSGPDLVAAVSNAGGFGILQAQLAPPPRLRAEIRKTREFTSKPFGASYDPQKSPANDCEPYNVPGAFLTPYMFDTRIGEREAIIRHEAYNVTRRIPLGAAAAQVESTGLFGTARARIDGNELVVEGSGYPPSAWGLALAVDVNGLGADIPSSEQKTLVERFSVSEDGLTLTVRYTVSDPVYLTAPYTGTAALDRVADDAPIYDFKCELDSAARFSRDP